MRDIEWLRALGFACIVVCSAPMVAGQTNAGKSHGGTPIHETVFRRTPQAAVVQKPSAAATTPKVMTTIAGQPPAMVSTQRAVPSPTPKGQPQTSEPLGPSGTLSFGGSSKGTQAPPQSAATGTPQDATGKVSLSPYTSISAEPKGTPVSAQSQTLPGKQPSGYTEKGDKQPPAGTRSGEPSVVVSTHSQPKGQPQGTGEWLDHPSTVHGQIPPSSAVTYQGSQANVYRKPSQIVPSTRGVVHPSTVQPILRAQGPASNQGQSTLGSRPSSPSQPTLAQPSSPQKSNPQTQSTEQHLTSFPSGNSSSIKPLPAPRPHPPMPALMLISKSHKPVAGKEVVVEATLTPQSDGATYQLDWGDGSAMETVRAPGLAEHRYTTAKTYTVSASTYVDGSHLYRQILLQVAPVVWPRVMSALAFVGALPFLGWHLVRLLLSASFRVGAPGVPEMRLLSREPYVSLSFEPGVRPAEERITFPGLRRKSG